MRKMAFQHGARQDKGCGRCRRLAGLVAPLFLLLAACDKPAPQALQGYAEGEYVQVGAPLAGILTTLSVRRGDMVKPGTPLFSLEHDHEAAAQREAAQRLASAQATLANLEKPKRPPEIAAVEEQIRQTAATVALDRKNLARQQALVRQGFTSRASTDQAQAEFARDSARLAELQQNLRIVQTGARPDEIRAAEANVRASQAALAQAAWNLAQKSVKAATVARVDDTLYVPGDWIAAGSPVVTLLPPGNVRVRFFVPETLLGEIQAGQRIMVTCDGCSGRIPATVRYIASEAEYTPPVLYNKDNRSKLVYMIEAWPDAGDAARLHPGQPVDVWLGH